MMRPGVVKGRQRRPSLSLIFCGFLVGVLFLWLSFVIKHSYEVEIYDERSFHGLIRRDTSMLYMHKANDTTRSIPSSMLWKLNGASSIAKVKDRSPSEWRDIESMVAIMDVAGPIEDDHFEFMDDRRNNNVIRKKVEMRENESAKEQPLSHLVVVTDCSFQADWQIHMLFHSARSVEQEGRLTRVAVDCSEKAKFELYNQYRRLWPEYNVYFYQSSEGTSKGLHFGAMKMPLQGVEPARDSELIEQSAVDDFVRFSAGVKRESMVVVLPRDTIFLRATSKDKFCSLAHVDGSREVAGVTVSTLNPHWVLSNQEVDAGAEIIRNSSHLPTEPHPTVQSLQLSKRIYRNPWLMVDSLDGRIHEVPHTTADHEEEDPVLLRYDHTSQPSSSSSSSSTSLPSSNFHFADYFFSVKGFTLDLFRCQHPLLAEVPTNDARLGLNSHTSSESSREDRIINKYEDKHNGDTEPQVQQQGQGHSVYPDTILSRRHAFAIFHLYRLANDCLMEAKSKVCPQGDSDYTNWRRLYKLKR